MGLWDYPNGQLAIENYNKIMGDMGIATGGTNKNFQVLDMEKRIKNPWENLAKDTSRNSFVLKEEQSIIAKFNAKVSEKYKIYENIFPAPFMGDVHAAPVLILMLNPGYDKDEDVNGTNYYQTYKGWWMQQIQHKLPYPELPLFCLEEEYCTKSKYWNEKLKPLIEKTDRVRVAKNVAKVQFFPYHSIKYKSIYKRLLKEEGFNSYLPSQEYNFELVRKTMQRGALIVIPRSKRFWYEAIPELEKYPNKHFTKNYRNPILSENNLGEIAFQNILEAIQMT